jgi:phospholipase C
LKLLRSLPRLWFTGLAVVAALALGALAFGALPAQADTTPVVTGVSPAAGPVTGGTTVTVTGSGFTDATAVDFGAAPAAGFTATSDTQITATSPAQSAGIVDVTVTGPDGTSATSAADEFSYAAAPTITGISPGYGSPAGGTSVAISGSGFTGTSEVQFGTADAAFTVVSDSQIAATTPPGSGAEPVTVTAPGGAANGQFIYTPIRHVVVLYLENHSFDSSLGYWCGDSPGRCPAGGMPASVTLSNGAVVTPSVDPDVVPQVDHGVASQQAAINGGAMNGWQNIQGGQCNAKHHYRCISGYEPSQEPNLSALATQFAISDRFFSQMDDWSWVAHIYAVAASGDGFTALDKMTQVLPSGAGWGCDSGKTNTWGPAAIQVPSCVPDPSLTYQGAPLPNGGAFEPTPVPYVPTIMDELSAAGLTWKIYGAGCTNETVAGDGLKTCMSAPDGYHWAICPTVAECLYSRGNDAPNAQFFSDAKAGTLPSFSIVTPGNAADSEHNGFSMTTGDDWLGTVARAIMRSPDWSSSALFITWDDCGCFYDQVPPGINPDGTQRGPRVPLVIVSPWAKPAFTDDTTATFASILAFTENTFGITPLTVNDAQAYDLSGAFDYSQRPVRPVQMVTRPQPKGDHIDWGQAKEDT